MMKKRSEAILQQKTDCAKHIRRKKAKSHRHVQFSTGILHFLFIICKCKLVGVIRKKSGPFTIPPSVLRET
jgi:hypothetical protein